MFFDFISVRHLLWLNNLDLCVFFEPTFFFANLIFHKPSYTKWFKTQVITPPWTCCVFDFISVSLYIGLSIWMCVSFLNLSVSQISCCLLICSTNSYEHEMSYSTFNVSCFWFHIRFPLLWITVLDLYVRFESTCFPNLILSIHLFHQFLWTWDFPLHLRCVAFLISYAFPSTLAYRFGFVCLLWTYDLFQIYWMVWSLLWKLRWLSF